MQLVWLTSSWASRLLLCSDIPPHLSWYMFAWHACCVHILSTRAARQAAHTPMQLCCPAGCSGGFMPLTRMQCHLGQKGAAPQQPHQSTAGPGSSAVCGSRLMLCRAALTAARPPLPRPSRKGCHPGRHLLLSSPMRPPPPRLPQHQGGRTSMLVLQASLKPLLRPGLAAHRGHGAAGRPEALVAPWLGSTSRLLHSDAGACIICLHFEIRKTSWRWRCCIPQLLSAPGHASTPWVMCLRCWSLSAP